jgi:hypothetical protein
MAPAANIWPTDMPQIEPTTIIGTDGGMIGPMHEAEAVSAAA